MHVVIFLFLAGVGGFLDFEEAVRSSKVLQGQENVGFVSPPLYGRDTVSRPLDFEMRAGSAPQSLALTGMVKSNNVNEFVARGQPTNYTGFMEPDRFPKVLQGQEICPLRSLTGKIGLDLGTWGKPNLGCSSFGMYQVAKPSFYPLPSDNLRNIHFARGEIYKVGDNSPISYATSNFQRENIGFKSSPVRTGIVVNEARNLNHPNETKKPESGATPSTLNSNQRNKEDELFNGAARACKLFGFPLTAEATAPSSQNSGKRSCTKVRDN